MDESATTTEAAGPSDSTPSSTTATEATPESTVAAEPAAEQKAQPAAAPEVDPWELIGKLDPEEIIRRDRRLAGRIGEHADRIATQRTKQERARWDAEQKAAQEAEQRRKLREEDPYAYVEQEKAAEQKAEEDRQQAATREKFEADIRNAVYGEVDLSLWDYYKTIPEAIQKEIAGKRYEGTRREAYLAFLADVDARRAALHATEVAEAKRVAKEEAHAEWVKTEKPRIVDAAKKDALSDAIAVEGTPDVSEGSHSNGHLSQEEFDRYRGDPKWRLANFDRMTEAVAAGRIRH